MRRREFIVLLGGVAARPFAARGQETDRRRRVGVLMGYAPTDPSAQSFLAAFVESLQASGWTVGKNISIETRWARGDTERIKKAAKELIDLAPEVILSNTTPVTVALHQATRTIPIVFAIVSDPVGAGLVQDLSRPSGNITGFINVEDSMGGKWLELLNEIATHVRRAAIMFNPDTAPGNGSYFSASFAQAARRLGIEPINASVRSDTDAERAITMLGGDGTGGLVVSADSFMVVHRATIISLAAQNKVPAIFFTPAFPKDGGLVAYGADSRDVFRRAGPYVDRILRGARPSELPIQVPTKFELVINLKTAKALSLTIPAAVLALADEVIE
jgi:ABC-type uncharacterized transport system substrate-binding protein